MRGRQNSINPFEDGFAWRALRGVPSFDEALARLLHTAEHGRPFGIVRGPAGSGKSALLSTVAEELLRSGQDCGRIDLRRLSCEEFAWSVAAELGAAPAKGHHHEHWRLVEDTLLGRASARRPTVLLIDHVGERDAGLLPEIRRLISVSDASAGWCTVLCAGRGHSPIVRELMCDHGELRIELGPFDADETGLFLQRVVDLYGCCRFQEGAVRLIHRHAGGVLQDILSLGRLALLAQTAEGTSEVTASIVEMVSAEVVSSSRRLESRSAPSLPISPDESEVVTSSR